MLRIRKALMAEQLKQATLISNRPLSLEQISKCC